MPFPILPALFGVANAGVGIFGAFSQNSAQRQQINAQNQALRRQYKEQLKIRGVQNAQVATLFGNKVQDYYSQLTENRLAAGKAYFSQQARLNELLQQAAFRDQDRYIQEAQAVGSSRARGVSGRSAARAEALTSAMFGRNAAIQQQGLANAGQAAITANRNTRESLMIANDNAYKQIRNAPVYAPSPLAPTFYSQPSNVGLYTGIGSSILDGISAGIKFDKMIG